MHFTSVSYIFYKGHYRFCSLPANILHISIDEYAEIVDVTIFSFLQSYVFSSL